MYSVQLEKLICFSLAEWSSDETPAVFFAAGIPQALSVPSPPSASAPPVPRAAANGG
jgi:hypothetical protein